MATLTMGTVSITGGYNNPQLSVPLTVSGAGYVAGQVKSFKLKDLSTNDLYVIDICANGAGAVWRDGNGATITPYIGWGQESTTPTSTVNTLRVSGQYPLTKLTPGHSFRFTEVVLIVNNSMNPLLNGSQTVTNTTSSTPIPDAPAPTPTPTATGVDLAFLNTLPVGSYLTLNPAPPGGTNLTQFPLKSDGKGFTLTGLSPATSYIPTINVPGTTFFGYTIPGGAAALPSISTSPPADLSVSSISSQADSIALTLASMSGQPLPGAFTSTTVTSAGEAVPGASVAIASGIATISGLSPDTSYNYTLVAAGFTTVSGFASTAAAVLPSLSAGTISATLNGISFPVVSSGATPADNSVIVDSLTSGGAAVTGYTYGYMDGVATFAGLQPGATYNIVLSSTGYSNLVTEAQAALPALGSSDVSAGVSSVSFTLTSTSGTLPSDASLNLVSISYGFTDVSSYVTMTPSGSDDTITFTGLPRTGTEYEAVIGAVGYEPTTVIFTTKPAVPTITAVTGGDEQITVAYDHNQGAAIAAGWKVVAHCLYQGVTTAVEADAYANGAAVSSAIFTGLTNEREYTIRLSIKNAAGNEGDKTAYWGSTVLVAAPLYAPSSVTATGSVDQITVYWVPAAYANMSSFNVVPYNGTVAKTAKNVTLSSGMNTTFTNADLDYGAYTFKVVALDTHGRTAESAASNEAIMTPAAADTPTLVDVLPKDSALDIYFTPVDPVTVDIVENVTLDFTTLNDPSGGTGSATLTYEYKNPTYTIDLNSGSGWVTHVSGISATSSPFKYPTSNTLTNGTTYQVRVKAVFADPTRVSATNIVRTSITDRPAVLTDLYADGNTAPEYPTTDSEYSNEKSGMPVNTAGIVANVNAESTPEAKRETMRNELLGLSTVPQIIDMQDVDSPNDLYTGIDANTTVPSDFSAVTVGNGGTVNLTQTKLNAVEWLHLPGTPGDSYTINMPDGTPVIIAFAAGTGSMTANGQSIQIGDYIPGTGVRILAFGSGGGSVNPIGVSFAAGPSTSSLLVFRLATPMPTDPSTIEVSYSPSSPGGGPSVNPTPVSSSLVSYNTTTKSLYVDITGLGLTPSGDYNFYFNSLNFATGPAKLVTVPIKTEPTSELYFNPFATTIYPSYIETQFYTYSSALPTSYAVNLTEIDLSTNAVTTSTLTTTDNGGYYYSVGDSSAQNKTQNITIRGLDPLNKAYKWQITATDFTSTDAMSEYTITGKLTITNVLPTTDASGYDVYFQFPGGAMVYPPGMKIGSATQLSDPIPTYNQQQVQQPVFYVHVDETRYRSLHSYDVTMVAPSASAGSYPSLESSATGLIANELVDTGYTMDVTKNESLSDSSKIVFDICSSAVTGFDQVQAVSPYGAYYQYATSALTSIASADPILHYYFDTTSRKLYIYYKQIGAGPPPMYEPYTLFRLVGTDGTNLYNAVYTREKLQSVTNLTLTPGVNTIDISWNDPNLPAADGSSKVHSYMVEYSSTSDTTWTPVSPNPTASPVQLTNLDSNTQYSVRVTALTSDSRLYNDAEPVSDQVMTNNNAPPLSNNTSATITIDGEEYTGGETIYLPAGTTSVSYMITLATGATSSITGDFNALVTGNNTITITVTAEDGATTQDYMFTLIVAVQNLAQPIFTISSNAPGTLTVTIVDSNGSPGLDPNAVSYSIVHDQRAGDTFLPGAFTNSSYTINSLTNGTPIEIRVKANGDGINYATSVTTTEYGTPQTQQLSVSVVASVAGNSAVTYTATSTNASSFQWSTGSGAISGATSATYTAGPPTASTPVGSTVYTVIAVGDRTNYTDSAASSGKTITMLAAPTNVVAAQGTNPGEISLSWSTVTNATSYSVQYSTDNSTWSSPVTATSPRTFNGLTEASTYTFRVTAVGSSSNTSNVYWNSDYGMSNATQPKQTPITDPNGGGNAGGGGTPVCFLADAPVLTARGYRPISQIKVGDKVRTADGRDVVVTRVYSKRYIASAATNPYVIPKGQFGATEALPISPNHEVMVPGRGMVRAKALGLRQMNAGRTFVYYNLELEDWVMDNLVVAGVEVESLAPVKRITMTMDEYAGFIKSRYGVRLESVKQRLQQIVFRTEDGRVNAPLFARN